MVISQEKNFIGKTNLSNIKISLLEKRSGITGGKIILADDTTPFMNKFVIVDNHDNTFTVYGQEDCPRGSGGPATELVDISNIATLTVKMFPLETAAELVDAAGRETFVRKEQITSKSPIVSGMVKPHSKPIIIANPANGMMIHVVNVGTGAANIVVTITWKNARFAPNTFIMAITETGREDGIRTVKSPNSPIVPSHSLLESYMIEKPAPNDPNKVQADKVKAEQLKQEQLKAEKVKADQVKAEKAKIDKIEADKVKQDQINTDSGIDNKLNEYKNDNKLNEYKNEDTSEDSFRREYRK